MGKDIHLITEIKNHVNMLRKSKQTKRSLELILKLAVLYHDLLQEQILISVLRNIVLSSYVQSRSFPLELFID